MFGSDVLDVVIGILFIYLTLSLICSAIQEAIAVFFRLRARYLYRGIRILLDDTSGQGLVRDFYSHPLIDTLFPGEYEPGRHRNLPSYIPARAFALAIMDLAAPKPASGALSGAAGATAVGQAFAAAGLTGISPLRDNLSRNSFVSPKVTQALITLSDAAAGDAAAIRQNIEQWYNNTMERVSSAYKRNTQFTILAVGCIVAAAVNADSINLVSALSTNTAVREFLVASAAQVSAVKAGSLETTSPGGPTAGSLPAGSETPSVASQQELSRIPACRADASSPDCRLLLNLNRIRDSGLPIGWVPYPVPGDLRGVPTSLWAWGQKMIGILLTIAAISMGAPFWFDVLNKITVVRSAIKPLAGESASQSSAAAAG